ncbi:MAG: hypothetical protein CMF96_10050 [Candidatus Marinimicrobia bacterium]|nr:hypothetical protein [Candidatus Neomarinimicrobiota bacterium]
MRFLNKFLISILLFEFAFSHGISEANKAKMVYGSLSDFITLGAEHMITGYDHILFLIGVIFFLTKFSDIVKFVTAFTLGHSITLIFATLLEITANYYLVDAIIALSVIYKGLENLGGFKKIFSIEPPNLIMMVFIFGLIHGFGLSTRLQQLALDESNLLMSILSFNLGVELGQIGALAIAYPLILLTRGMFMDVISKIANWGLVIAGMYLVFFQLDNYFSQHNHHEEPTHQVEIYEDQHGHDDDSEHSHGNGEPQSHDDHSNKKEDEHHHHDEDPKHSHDDENNHNH